MRQTFLKWLGLIIGGSLRRRVIGENKGSGDPG
jgi:hypothetical protein